MLHDEQNLKKEEDEYKLDMEKLHVHKAEAEQVNRYLRKYARASGTPNRCPAMVTMEPMVRKSINDRIKTTICDHNHYKLNNMKKHRNIL